MIQCRDKKLLINLRNKEIIKKKLEIYRKSEPVHNSLNKKKIIIRNRENSIMN